MFQTALICRIVFDVHFGYYLRLLCTHVLLSLLLIWPRESRLLTLNCAGRQYKLAYVGAVIWVLLIQTMPLDEVFSGWNPQNSSGESTILDENTSTFQVSHVKDVPITVLIYRRLNPLLE